MDNIIDALVLEREDGKIITDDEIKLIIEMNMDILVKEIKKILEDL